MPLGLPSEKFRMNFLLNTLDEGSMTLKEKLDAVYAYPDKVISVNVSGRAEENGGVKFEVTNVPYSEAITPFGEAVSLLRELEARIKVLGESLGEIVRIRDEESGAFENLRVAEVAEKALPAADLSKPFGEEV